MPAKADSGQSGGRLPVPPWSVAVPVAVTRSGTAVMPMPSRTTTWPSMLIAVHFGEGRTCSSVKSSERLAPVEYRKFRQLQSVPLMSSLSYTLQCFVAGRRVESPANVAGGVGKRIFKAVEIGLHQPCVCAVSFDVGDEIVALDTADLHFQPVSEGGCHQSPGLKTTRPLLYRSRGKLTTSPPGHCASVPGRRDPAPDADRWRVIDVDFGVGSGRRCYVPLGRWPGRVPPRR